MDTLDLILRGFMPMHANMASLERGDFSYQLLSRRRAQARMTEQVRDPILAQASGRTRPWKRLSRV